MKNRFNVLLLAGMLFLHIQLAAQLKNAANESERKTFMRCIQIDNRPVNRGVSVIEINDGYVLTGYTGIGDSNDDVFLLKTDFSGQTIWSKIIELEASEKGWAVRQTNDRGFIIVGFTNSIGAGEMDVFLTKTDSSGNVTWSKSFGGQGEEFGWDVQVASDGGFIIAAQTNSFGNGDLDAYLIKTDENGNEIWSRTYGGSKVDRVFSIQQTSSGGYVAAGITYSYTSATSNDRDGYLLKVDAFGKEEWFKTFGKEKYDVIHSVSLSADGDYILTGYGESYAQTGGRDAYLIKTDNTGETIWTQIHGGSANERGINGEQTEDGGYVVIGFTDEDLNAYLLKTDNQGNALWTRTFGEKDQLEFGYSVKETRDGGYILLGHRENLSNKQSQVLLIKTDGQGLLKTSDKN